ncbi:hypothetical protein M432DRAFT_643167 [Thermoascus aurantiacus ATCC 26904]
MAIATGGANTYGRKTAVSSRNVALASLVTISGAMYAAFRYMRARGERTGENERRFQAHGDVDPNKQTDQGTLRSAPGPRYKWNRGS